MPRRDYSGAIAWLHGHGIPEDLIANLFDVQPQSVRMIAWRSDQGLLTLPVKRVASDLVLAGERTDKLLNSTKVESEPQVPRTRTEVAQLEGEIDDFGAHFWEHVRNREGARRLGLLLRRVSRPRTLLLKRAAARLYHLLAELYVHAGFCRSSLHFGHRAYVAESLIFKETHSRVDVNTIAKTCLLISLAFMLRSEFEEARVWILRSSQAFEAAGCREDSAPYVDPELPRQLAIVQFHFGYIGLAQQNLRKAQQLLPLYNRSATVAQVRDVGERFLNLVSEKADWEAGFTLKDFALDNWPQGDIHHALNVNWAAAEALTSGSPEAERRALALLHEMDHLSIGYVQQETVTELLKMTANVPAHLRSSWVKFSLYYNTFRNK